MGKMTAARAPETAMTERESESALRTTNNSTTTRGLTSRVRCSLSSDVHQLAHDSVRLVVEVLDLATECEEQSASNDSVDGCGAEEVDAKSDVVGEG